MILPNEDLRLYGAPLDLVPTCSRRVATPPDPRIPLAPCSESCRKPCAKSRRALHALLISIGLLGCRSEAPPAPAASVELSTYHGRDLDVSVAYPSTFTPDERGPEVVFRNGGAPAIRIVWVTEEEADDRGLWAGHQGAPATIAGRAGMVYDYDHRDFERFTRTISYVVPYRGRWLGLEFRTDEPELPEAYQRVLESLQLEAEV